MARITIASLTARLDAAEAAYADLASENAKLRRLLVQADRAVPAETEACKRCDGSGVYGEHGSCFRCDGSGKDPGVVAGRTQFRARRRQAATQPARAPSAMAEAARRYCAEHGVTSCTVEQARSML